MKTTTKILLLLLIIALMSCESYHEKLVSGENYYFEAVLDNHEVSFTSPNGYGGSYGHDGDSFALGFLLNFGGEDEFSDSYQVTFNVKAGVKEADEELNLPPETLLKKLSLGNWDPVSAKDDQERYITILHFEADKNEDYESLRNDILYYNHFYDTSFYNDYNFNFSSFRLEDAYIGYEDVNPFNNKLEKVVIIEGNFNTYLYNSENRDDSVFMQANYRGYLVSDDPYK